MKKYKRDGFIKYKFENGAFVWVWIHSRYSVFNSKVIEYTIAENQLGECQSVSIVGAHPERMDEMAKQVSEAHDRGRKLNIIIK